MSRMWGAIAAGAAGAVLGMELSSLVDPAFSAFGAVDTSSFVDAFNGQPDFDGFDATSSDPDYSSYTDHPSSNPSVPEHLNHALHTVAGGVAAQASYTNTGPLVNRNGLPILRRLNLTDPHTCSHCGEFIFGTRLKCK
ncbi:hypothetical protein AURDEDRAFT_170031 [Auricularia subglabra TFB-10046 SS5]|uniref:Uncharacterized protein n=1 Tax=Auricularia subglabra (strain TFB-10046 / SS5) TaxID=717982 RepID=J0D273_AURST|nr:hypothetical protein AURDEDRAFT_170031 [Auricularia subglabra TFB-10046 SS5]